MRLCVGFKKFLSLSALGFFVMSAVFGVGFFFSHHHEPGCPFMPGEEVVCQMGVFDYLLAFRLIFTVIIPAGLICTLLVWSVILSARREQTLDPSIFFALRRRSDSSFVEDFLAWFFSIGILHPKAP